MWHKIIIIIITLGGSSPAGLSKGPPILTLLDTTLPSSAPLCSKSSCF